MKNYQDALSKLQQNLDEKKKQLEAMASVLEETLNTLELKAAENSHLQAENKRLSECCFELQNGAKPAKNAKSKRERDSDR